jgi:DNA topoisomerase-1
MVASTAMGFRVSSGSSVLRARRMTVVITKPSVGEVVAPAAADPVVSAKIAGLRYVHDGMPGIHRFPAGRGFRYLAPDGAKIIDRDELVRFASLAIPPAWIDVWITPHPNGHLQATGRDARGRKQYRYHPRWREVRDEAKYDRMIIFGKALPALRAQVAADLGLPGLPRDKVLAAVVRLLDMTHIRVGNEEYARQNGSFGLTTMRNHHVAVEGATLRFKFRGKSGVKHVVDLNDRRLARVVARCQALPGQELFQFQDGEGGLHPIDSADVNEYLRRHTGHDLTAKDFRTWAGTVLAARELAAAAGSESEAQAKRVIVAAVEAVAGRLGNTVAVCRKCYVHPGVLDGYLDGSLAKALAAVAPAVDGDAGNALDPDEAAVLTYLEALGGR